MNDHHSQWTDFVAHSDIVKYSFDLRSPTFSAESASNLVGWLIEEYALKSCAFLATAAARVLGREHYVALTHPDDRIAHAVLACSPQFDSSLKGYGVDIFGRRPLREIVENFRALAGPTDITIGNFVPPEDFDEGEEAVLLELAYELPWMGRVLRGAPRDPDGERLMRIAARLGMTREENRSPSVG